MIYFHDMECEVNAISIILFIEKILHSKSALIITDGIQNFVSRRRQ